jgi:hypothetical protein
MTMALEVEHLTGGYSQLPVLKDVSFNVQPGELVGPDRFKRGRQVNDDQSCYRLAAAVFWINYFKWSKSAGKRRGL